MNLELARTFLEIATCGSFARAAERLNVAHTTVSARVRLLEEHLGGALFVRSKSGAALTSAGRQFLRHATILVQLWERARHEVAAPDGTDGVVAVGAELSLWNPLLLQWLTSMRRNAAALAVRCRVDLPESLLGQVLTGVLDIAVTYVPQHRPGLRIEPLIEEHLVLVQTPGTSGDDADYIYVDWGPQFSARHDAAFPYRSNPRLLVGLGPLALDYMLQNGGMGYFRLGTVRGHLASDRLERVKNAPEFVYPAYAIYVEGAQSEGLATALRELRSTAAEPSWDCLAR